MRMAASVVCLALAVAACGVAPASRAEDRGPVTKHTLWKIEDGRAPVYLLGSIHVMRRQNYPLERPIEDAFDQARVVAFEIDLDEARAALKRMKPVRGTPPPRRSLRSQVSDKTYRSVVRYLEGAGIPSSTFDRLPPALAATALIQLELAKLGFDPQWGVDAYFYRRARKYGKTVVPLETVDEQIEALRDLSERDSDELVAAALQDAAELRTMLRDVIRAWKGGEVDRLVPLVNGSFADRPELYQRVLIDRNARWLPKIEALMAGEVPALVVVGTGHLVGHDSVVAMLEAKGHVVRQQ